MDEGLLRGYIDDLLQKGKSESSAKDLWETLEHYARLNSHSDPEPTISQAGRQFPSLLIKHAFTVDNTI